MFEIFGEWRLKEGKDPKEFQARWATWASILIEGPGALRISLHPTSDPGVFVSHEEWSTELMRNVGLRLIGENFRAWSIPLLRLVDFDFSAEVPEVASPQQRSVHVREKSAKARQERLELDERCQDDMDWLIDAQDHMPVDPGDELIRQVQLRLTRIRTRLQNASGRKELADFLGSLVGHGRSPHTAIELHTTTNVDLGEVLDTMGERIRAEAAFTRHLRMVRNGFFGSDWSRLSDMRSARIAAVSATRLSFARGDNAQAVSVARTYAPCLDDDALRLMGSTLASHGAGSEFLGVVTRAMPRNSPARWLRIAEVMGASRIDQDQTEACWLTACLAAVSDTRQDALLPQTLKSYSLWLESVGREPEAGALSDWSEAIRSGQGQKTSAADEASTFVQARAAELRHELAGRFAGGAGTLVGGGGRHGSVAGTLGEGL